MQRAKFKIRSEAAKRGWETRRKNQAAKRLKPRQEYYVTVINRERGRKQGKKRESPLPPKHPKPGTAQSSYLPDFLVIHDKGMTTTAIVAYLIYWIETNYGEDKKWWATVIRHAWATGRLLVAAGPETSEPQGVKEN